MKSSVLIVITFFLGCVTAKFVPIEIPKAHGDNGDKWEGWCVPVSEALNTGKTTVFDKNEYKMWNQFLNKVGSEGWKLEVVEWADGHRSGIYEACFTRRKT